jgi:hypothetical protein
MENVGGESAEIKMNRLQTPKTGPAKSFFGGSDRDRCIEFVGVSGWQMLVPRTTRELRKLLMRKTESL